MDRIFFRRTGFWTAVVVGAAFCFFPANARAVDAVKKLKDAVAAVDFKLIENTIPELKSINEMRRGFFLGDWGVHREIPIDPNLAALRNKIGERLALAVTTAADKAGKDGNVNSQVAVARMIAELAESEKSEIRSDSGKYAAKFVPLLTKLAGHPDLLVRQCALDALGKVTPKPADAMPIFLKALKGSDLGPRRLAAYAMLDLVKNANYLERADELATVAEAINAAAIGMASDDELIVAYSLQTIHGSAKLFTDYPRSNDSIFVAEKDPQKTEIPGVLKAFHDANPGIVKALQGNASVEIRLTALEAMSHVVAARLKIIDKLAEFQEKGPADKRPNRIGVFKKGEDPLGILLDRGWDIVPGLLKPNEDVRLRRGAIALLETVAEDVDQAITEQKMDKAKSDAARLKILGAIRVGLYDSDRVVRWSAARTLRYTPTDLIDAKIIEGLGHMLTDRSERDFDLSATAAASLEAIAASPSAAKAMRFLKSAIVDREKDVEIRESSLRIVVLIGSAGNEAFPEITSVLTDENVRIRRAATEALGLLGRPATRQHYDDAIAALTIAMRDDDAQVRQNAPEAILSIVAPK